MFDDSAPLWRFKEQLGAIEGPELSRTAESGPYLVEVFPALALPAFEAKFCGRLRAPKYNPAKRKKFRQSDWIAVGEIVRRYTGAFGIGGMETWSREAMMLEEPKKSDQDRLDAALCVLIGIEWRFGPRSDSIMIGDLNNGYVFYSFTENNLRGVTLEAYLNDWKSPGYEIAAILKNGTFKVTNVTFDTKKSEFKITLNYINTA